MVASGEVHARINERDGMVTFIEDPEAYNSSGMAAKIEGAVSKCMQLAEKLQAVNEAVSVSRQQMTLLTMPGLVRVECPYVCLVISGSIWVTCSCSS